MLDFFGQRIYHAGDTALFGDMSLIARANLDLALLPIGDFFTMGPDDAAEAVRLLAPRYVIPMHYNTWPTIAQDPTTFRRLVADRTKAECVILEPGSDWAIP